MNVPSSLFGTLMEVQMVFGLLCARKAAEFPVHYYIENLAKEIVHVKGHVLYMGIYWQKFHIMSTSMFSPAQYIIT